MLPTDSTLKDKLTLAPSTVILTATCVALTLTPMTKVALALTPTLLAEAPVSWWKAVIFLPRHKTPTPLPPPLDFPLELHSLSLAWELDIRPLQGPPLTSLAPLLLLQPLRDHSRAESADGNLNVQGHFSFVADDGVTRNVNYEAGANRGFQASGDHLPTAPQPHSASRPAATSFASHTPSLKSGPAASTFSRPSSHSYSDSGSASSPSRIATGRPFGEANTRTQTRPDGSYSFSYQTPTHSRAESGDADNNVDGNFAFVADDGQSRAISYEAGSDTGFIAEGAHIPVGPEVPGAPSGQPTGRIVPVRQTPFVDPRRHQR
nr:uncharacterized protein LOC113804432 [Penaeus vannamei]